MRLIITLRLLRDIHLHHTLRSAWRRAGELACG